jgi:hypothetical protein
MWEYLNGVIVRAYNGLELGSGKSHCRISARPVNEFTWTDLAPTTTTRIYREFGNGFALIDDFELFDREYSLCERSACRAIIKSAGQ